MGCHIKEDERKQGWASNCWWEEAGLEDADLLDVSAGAAPLPLEDSGDEEDRSCGARALNPCQEEGHNGLPCHLWRRGPEGELVSQHSGGPNHSFVNVQSSVTRDAQEI